MTCNASYRSNARFTFLEIKNYAKLSTNFHHTDSHYNFPRSLRTDTNPSATHRDRNPCAIPNPERNIYSRTALDLD